MYNKCDFLTSRPKKKQKNPRWVDMPISSRYNILWPAVLLSAWIGSGVSCHWRQSVEAAWHSYRGISVSASCGRHWHTPRTSGGSPQALSLLGGWGTRFITWRPFFFWNFRTYLGYSSALWPTLKRPCAPRWWDVRQISTCC